MPSVNIGEFIGGHMTQRPKMLPGIKTLTIISQSSSQNQSATVKNQTAFPQTHLEYDTAPHKQQ